MERDNRRGGPELPSHTEVDLLKSIVGRKLQSEMVIIPKGDSTNSDRFPQQLHVGASNRAEVKVLHSTDNGFKKVPQKLRLNGSRDPESGRNGDAESNAAGVSISREHSRRAGRKPLRKRRKPKPEDAGASPHANRSGSGSQEKGLQMGGGKQIKIAKDKYSLPRGGRRPNQTEQPSSQHHTNTSQGMHGEKTLKLVCKVGKDKSTTAAEEKKKAFETMNETIRRNNMKPLGSSKDPKDHSSSQGGIHSSNTPASAVFKKLLHSGAALHKIENSTDQNAGISKAVSTKPDKPTSSTALVSKVFNQLSGAEPHKRKSPLGSSVSPSSAVQGAGSTHPLVHSLQPAKHQVDGQSNNAPCKQPQEQNYHSNPTQQNVQSAVQYIQGLKAVNLPSSKVGGTAPITSGGAVHNHLNSTDRGVSEEPKKAKKEASHSKKEPSVMKKSSSTKPLLSLQTQAALGAGAQAVPTGVNPESSNTAGHLTPLEHAKNKNSMLKLEKKPKPASKVAKGFAKRLHRQRRSKSSNDLISENLFKQFMGRSDSVNSKHINEDQLYEEWRKILPQDSHSAMIKEKYVRGTFRDQLQRAAQGLNPKTGHTSSPTAASGPKHPKPKPSKKEKQPQAPGQPKKSATSEGPRQPKQKLNANATEYMSELSRMEGTISARHKAMSMLGYIPVSSFQKELEGDKRANYLNSTIQKNYESNQPSVGKSQGKHPIALFGINPPFGQQIQQLTEGTKRTKRTQKKTQVNGTAGNSHPKKPHSTKETQQQFYVGKGAGNPGRQSQGQSKEGTAMISTEEFKGLNAQNKINIQSGGRRADPRDSNPQAQQKELNSGVAQSNFQSSELNTDERELIDREILMPKNYNSDNQSENFQRAGRTGLNLGQAATQKSTNPISITQNSPDPAMLVTGNSRMKSSSSLLGNLPASTRNGQLSQAEPSEQRVGAQEITELNQHRPARPYEQTGFSRKIRDSASSDEDFAYQTEGGLSHANVQSGQRYTEKTGDLTPAQTDYLIQLLQNTAVFNSEGTENLFGLLNELKRYQQGGQIDEEVKERLRSFLEKTQRGLTQILHSSGMSNQTGRSSDKSATPNKLAEHTKSNHKRHSAKSRPDEGAWKKKPHLGLDLDDYEIDAEFSEADRNTRSIPEKTDSASQGRSFQWLRVEYEKNMDEIGKLLGNNRKDELKQLGELIKSNEEFSKVFDLRSEALNKRYSAQRDQIQRTGASNQAGEELLLRLEEWHRDEQAQLEVEKRRITTIWLKSIDEVRKIKRDLEIATDSRRIPGAMHEIYSAISRSLASPSGGAFHRKIALGSPGSSPLAQKNRLVSDPEVIPARKRPDIWPKHEEELGRSSEGLEPRISGSVDRSRTSLVDSGRIEISENKKSLVREIEDGLRKGTKIPSLNGSGHLGGVLGRVIDLRGIGSSPGPVAGAGSADSSALFAVSPTVGTGGSKLQSSHKPRSTAKSGEDPNPNHGPIWIKDQQEPVPIAKAPPQPAKNTSSGSIGGLAGNLTESGPLEFPIKEHDLMYNKSLPPTNHKESANSQQQPQIPAKDVRLESHSQPNGIGNPLESSNGLLTSGAVFGLESIRRELEKIPPRLEDTQGSGRRETASREATKKSSLSKTGGNGDTDEYMMYDLIDGIGFDSGAINHEFEDSKKSPCDLDDFASLSDSGREGVVVAAKHARREKLLHEADIVADQILDSLFDEAARGIVEILESENQKIENEIQEEYDQREPGIIHAYGNDPHYNAAWKGPQHVQGFVPGDHRRGIRVNYNAIREYLSFLVNFVKNSDLETQKDIMTRLNSPQGPSPAEKLMMFNEDLDELQGGVTARAISRKVVGYDVYTRLEDELASGKENEDQFKQKTEHVHNKMLFDSFNEALDNFRPYGLKGCPFPWRPNAGRIVAVQTLPEHFGEVLDRAQERVLEWAMFMCGFIPNKDDSMLGDIVLEEDYLNQIKEDRLIKMLTCEAFETDERWLIYDDEEVEVQTEVAELVFDALLEEVVSSLASIQGQRCRPTPKSV